MNANGKKGFTLIELMVVIIIIGILAGVLLVTVRSVLIRARDSRIQAAFVQIRTQAELYWDVNVAGGYKGLSAAQNVQAACDDVSKNNGVCKWGGDCKNNYTVWSILNAGGCYCLDSDGFLCALPQNDCTALQEGSSMRCNCSQYEPSNQQCQ